MFSAGNAEVFRAGLGAILGLGLATLAFDLLARPEWGLLMIAPFGATAVLLFAVPNSPLAQPWSAIGGNVVSALAGILVVSLEPAPWLSGGLAVGLAIMLMRWCRALHPPGGAVALTAALNPEMVHELGWLFALAPVFLGTAALTLLAVPYARATGRRYPFRQAPDPNPHGTGDAPALERLGLSRAELAGILARFRQSPNIGVEDLARLIGAAETLAAQHHLNGLQAGEFMSRDLVTVAPDANTNDIKALFTAHAFTSLPVISADGAYLGLIYQLHLLAAKAGDLARDLMQTDLPQVTPETPVSALLPILSKGENDALPVLQQGRLVGIITQTDLIAALAKPA